MKLTIACIFWLCITAGCGSATTQNDAVAAIPFDTMQLILKDIHYADALANREGEPNGTTEALTKSYYNAVFAKYKISEKTFYDSYHYYIREAGQIDSMYVNIINEISKDQAVVQGDNQTGSTN